MPKNYNSMFLCEQIVIGVLLITLNIDFQSFRKVTSLLNIFGGVQAEPTVPITESSPIPSSIKVKAGYTEASVDVGLGLSVNVLTINIPEAAAAQQGSFDGGKRVDVFGFNLTGSSTPSVEALGATVGFLDIEGASQGNIVEGILNTEIYTAGGAAGEILNAKVTRVYSGRGDTNISGTLIGASLGVGVFAADADFPLGTIGSTTRVTGGLGDSTKDTLDYIKRNPGNAKLDSVKTAIENRTNNEK